MIIFLYNSLSELSLCGENIEIKAPLLLELEEKLKSLLEFLFLIFLIIIIMNLFKQLVLVMCNPVMEG